MERYRHHELVDTRRDFLLRTGAGFGSLALAHLLQADHARADPVSSGAVVDYLAPKQPHFAPRAKSVIFLFMEGGPSHIDLFDPKPLLNELDGQTLPSSFTSLHEIVRQPIPHPPPTDRRSWAPARRNPPRTGR